MNKIPLSIAPWAPPHDTMQPRESVLSVWRFQALRHALLSVKVVCLLGIHPTAHCSSQATASHEAAQSVQMIENWCSYDSNGNVLLLTDAEARPTARYEYDAFGKTIAATGPAAEGNRYRFSTKPIDAGGGLAFYGCRYYSPAVGSWTSHDPLGEANGSNLYGICNNQMLSNIDYLGLSINVSGTMTWNDVAWSSLGARYVLSATYISTYEGMEQDDLLSLNQAYGWRSFSNGSEDTASVNVSAYRGTAPGSTSTANIGISLAASSFPSDSDWVPYWIQFIEQSAGPVPRHLDVTSGGNPFYGQGVQGPGNLSDNPDFQLPANCNTPSSLRVESYLVAANKYDTRVVVLGGVVWGGSITKTIITP